MVAISTILAREIHSRHSSKAGPYFAGRLEAVEAALLQRPDAELTATERRAAIDLEEMFVERTYELVHRVTNEFELVKPENIVTLDSLGAGAQGITRMVTSLSPAVAKNDDMVTVSFYSSKPQPNDWIAAYSPPDVDITKTVPVKYAWADTDKDFNKTHHGSLRFNMTNLRQGVKFYYMTNGLIKGAAANITGTKTLTWANPNEQLRPRIVATGDPDVFTLLWSSASSAQPQLKWRATTTGAYTTIVAATTDSVKKSELCGYPANDKGWFDTGLIHQASLKGMAALAGKTIHYTFGCVPECQTHSHFPWIF